MTFWLDAHLDPKLAAWMGSRFHVIAKHVAEIDLLQASDRDLFAAAKRFGNITIMTKDDDFIDLVTRYRVPPQIIRLTCGNRPTIAVQALLTQHFEPAIKLLEGGEPWVEIG